ncbi:hypothetical protein BC829DRAFT_385976 [Chytridium lagenaria]|nr:hypothetical protein BC829DRAFT_385976 [Chytridium lagenaria]
MLPQTFIIAIVVVIFIAILLITLLYVRYRKNRLGYAQKTTSPTSLTPAEPALTLDKLHLPHTTLTISTSLTSPLLMMTKTSISKTTSSISHIHTRKRYHHPLLIHPHRPKTSRHHHNEMRLLLLSRHMRRKNLGRHDSDDMWRWKQKQADAFSFKTNETPVSTSTEGVYAEAVKMIMKGKNVKKRASDTAIGKTKEVQRRMSDASLDSAVTRLYDDPSPYLHRNLTHKTVSTTGSIFYQIDTPSRPSTPPTTSSGLSDETLHQPLPQQRPRVSTVFQRPTSPQRAASPGMVTLSHGRSFRRHGEMARSPTGSPVSPHPHRHRHGVERQLSVGSASTVGGVTVSTVSLSRYLVRGENGDGDAEVEDDARTMDGEDEEESDAVNPSISRPAS